MKIDDFILKLKNLQTVCEEKIMQIVEKEQEYITDLNKIQMFFDSIQSDGKKITKIKSPLEDSWYAKATEEYHKGKSFSFKGFSKKKIHGDPYHLKDTGQFFSSFNLKIKDNSFSINAKKLDIQGKEIDMEKNFGKKIYGLSEENSKILTNEILIPQLVIFLNTNYFHD